MRVLELGKTAFVRRLALAAALTLAATSAAAQPQPSRRESAAQIVQHWRGALNVRSHPRSTAHARYSVADNGLASTVDEWVTRDGYYRRVFDRGLDRTDLLVTPEGAWLRDWNGFVRDLEGVELRRTRTQAFTAAVLAFGPPPELETATARATRDRKAWTLTFTPQNGVAMTWYVDQETKLPTKTVLHDSSASRMSAAYSDWRQARGVFAPQLVTVTESDDPPMAYTRTQPIAIARTRARDFAALAPGPPDVAMGLDSVALPFTMEANHIVVQTQINGRPPIGFLLDTGAAYQVISTPRLAQFGLTSYGAGRTTGGGGQGASTYTRIASLTMPGVEVRNQHALVLDLSGLERAWGVPIGGILGYDFISRFVIEIDHERKIMTLHRPGNWRYDGDGAVVPLSFDGGMPYVDAMLSAPGKPRLAARMILDVGASDTMILTAPFVAANDLQRLAGTSTAVTGTAGLENQFFAQRNTRGRIDSLWLGGMEVQGIPVSFSANTSGAYASAAFAGTIGEGIFNRFHMYIDYPRRRVILEATAKSNEPFPERRTFGATLLAGGPDLRTFTVSGVRAGSPAEAAGLRQNDVIVGLDARSAQQLTLGELREILTQEGRRRVIRVRRGGQTLTITTNVTLVSLDR